MQNNSVRKGLAIIFSINNRLWAIVALVILPVQLLIAQDHFEVVPGEYVIEPGFAAGALAGDSAAVLNNEDLNVERNLGQNSFLVKAKNSAGQLYSASADSAADFCAELLKNGTAKSCSPNYVISVSATPNDPSFGQLWGLRGDAGINAEAAWDQHTDSENVVVAVIDTGVDYNHNDLKQNIWVNSAEIPGNGLDDDSNGYIDDIHGISAIGANRGDPIDENGHGSHVAGTIGGRGNNGTGVTGINWKAKIMPLKFLGANGSGSLAGAVEAINYMVMMRNRGVNVRVSNNSWGGGGFSQSMYNAIQSAHTAGIIFVAAAGNASNDNDANPSYPASYDLPNVVSVAAIDSETNLASFSNYGATQVDIAAPGVGIYSTSKNGGYATLSGTSMAAPHVTGALTFLLSAFPALNNASIVNRLYVTAKPASTLTDVVKTGRSVDLARAMNNDQTPLPEPTPEPDSCSYRIDEINYSPDKSADQGQIVNQTDEFGFNSVALGFSFPFHHDFLGNVFVSPNGLVYTKKQPTAMDYKNSSIAPLNSIAALHSDLKGNIDPYGLRFAGDNEKAVFYWNSQIYGNEPNGSVKIRMVLKKDGVIETFVEALDSRLLAQLQKKGTMGLSWRTSGSAVVFAYNSDRIKARTAVRYTPQCGKPGNDFKINDLKAKGLAKSGKYVGYAIPGRPIRIQAEAQGDGDVPVAISLNGLQCSGSFSLPVRSGYGEIYSTMAEAAWRFKQVSFVSGSLHKTLKIKRSKVQKSRLERVRSIRTSSRRHLNKTSPRFIKSCNAIMAGL